MVVHRDACGVVATKRVGEPKECVPADYRRGFEHHFTRRSKKGTGIVGMRGRDPPSARTCTGATVGRKNNRSISSGLAANTSMAARWLASTGLHTRVLARDLPCGDDRTAPPCLGKVNRVRQ